MSRLPPIAEKDLTEEQREVARALVNGPRGVIVGPFIPLLRNPGLASRVEKVGEYLRYGGLLPKRLMELTVLIVGEACRSPFEWYSHAPLGLKAGLPQSVIDSVGAGRRPETDDAEILAVYDFAAMLLREKAVTEPVYRRALASLGDAGVVELVGVCGYYTLLAMMLNVAEIGAPAEAPAPFAQAVAGADTPSDKR
jgi:4-carboxymuconolactone decarboxylase